MPNEEWLSSHPKLQETYGEQRRFYTCNSGNTYTYLNYVSGGCAKSYVVYADNPEKSSGIFNANGKLNAKDKRELAKQLKHTKSAVWDYVLSFSENFGKIYCDNYEQAYELMRIEFPRFLKLAGLKVDNIGWYAGLHTQTDNRHIHISFFEMQPLRYSSKDNSLHYSSGHIPQRCLEDFKVRVEQKLTDISGEIKLGRKQVLDLYKTVLMSKLNSFKNNSELTEDFQLLLCNLPKEGRLSYDSENMKELRVVVRGIVDKIIKSDEKLLKEFNKFCGQLNSHDLKTLEILKTLKVPKERFAHYKKASIYLDDFYNRMGNQIINAAKVFKKSEKYGGSRSVQKRYKKESLTKLLKYSEFLKNQIEQDAFFAFRDYLRKLEDEKNKLEQDLGEEYYYEL